MKIPRGIRNKNPFNIRISHSDWQGKVPVSKNTDGAFEQFVSMEYGIRAGMKLLRNYIQVHGIDTIREIISRFAPSNENDTGAYIRAVAMRTGFDKDKHLNADKNTLTRLAGAIMAHENGGDYVTAEKIERAWEML